MQTERNQNSTADIRSFLTKTFSNEELSHLCFDYFPDVYDNFAEGMEKGKKIQHLIEYCQRHGILPNLLAALHTARPSQYEQRFPLFQVVPELSQRERNPRQVFISHAYENADFAHRLAQDLQKHGWQVWIAPDSIRAGEKWVDAINRALEESGVFVLVVTPAAITSQWVNTETSAAIELSQQEQLRFIPLDVESCKPLPLWNTYHNISFVGNYNNGLMMLLAALAQDNQASIGQLPQQQGRAEHPEQQQEMIRPILLPISDHVLPADKFGIPMPSRRFFLFGVDLGPIIKTKLADSRKLLTRIPKKYILLVSLLFIIVLFFIAQPQFVQKVTPLKTTQPTVKSPPPTSSAHVAWEQVLNGEQVQDMILYRDDLWIATKAGVIRYVTTSGESTQFTSASVLPSNKILALITVPDGEIWVGTDGSGVGYFDGTLWKSFTVQNGLADNTVTLLARDGNGFIWAGTSRGVSRFDGKQWHTFRTSDGLLSNQVLSMFVDSSGLLWIGTDRGISYFDGNAWHTPATAFDDIAGAVYSIGEDQSGRLLVGIGSNLYMMQKANGESHLQLQIESTLPISVIHRDAQGVNWVGGGPALYSSRNGWVNTTSKGQNLATSPSIRTIAHDSKGTIWAGTTEGLYRFDAETLQPIDIEQPGNNINVTAIAMDMDGYMWLGSRENGVYRFSEEAGWRSYTNDLGLQSDNVWDLEVSKNGVLWAATSNGVVNYRDSNWQQVEQVKHLPADALLVDSKGTLWIGMREGGVHYQRNGQWAMLSKGDGLLDDRVKAIYEDQNGTIWFGTAAGVNYLPSNSSELQAIQETIDIPISAFLEDSVGILWIGTDGRGLLRYDGQKLSSIQPNHLFSNIWALARDDENHIWVGTSGGVGFFDGNQWTVLTSANTNGGLPDDRVRSIVAGQGVVWIGTDSGVVRYAP
jgi:ligand-binding sensor domain-containing protein